MRLRNVLFLSLLSLAPMALAACGGPSSKVANVKPDNMPDGEEWAGVYYHPIYGELHLIEQETNVVGRWKRRDESAWGELQGVKTGNVVHFTWKEKKYGLVGPAAESAGKGYFAYKMNENGLGVVDGQWGLGSDEIGSEWKATKQKNKKPDLKSISGANPDQQGAPSALE